MNKKQSIAMVFDMWPILGSEAKTPEGVVKSYEVALMYLEPWSLERAVLKFVQGKVENHNAAFRPSPPQIAQLANKIQNEENRYQGIIDRVSDQTSRLEYQQASKEERQVGVDAWRVVRDSLLGLRIDELARLYIDRKISVPGTTFDIHGAHYPDGQHHDIEQMRRTVR
jgi:hypothetical protein